MGQTAGDLASLDIAACIGRQEHVVALFNQIVQVAIPVDRRGCPAVRSRECDEAGPGRAGPRQPQLR